MAEKSEKWINWGKCKVYPDGTMMMLIGPDEILEQLLSVPQPLAAWRTRDASYQQWTPEREAAAKSAIEKAQVLVGNRDFSCLNAEYQSLNLTDEEEKAIWGERFLTQEEKDRREERKRASKLRQIL